MLSLEEKAALIRSRVWWHSIEIGDGLVTPGQVPSDYLARMLGYLRFPQSFAGLSVLDIGAWDGFFSFEAERRGAKRVVAYDLFPPDYHGFALARDLRSSAVEYVQGSVYELAPATVGSFDVVFCFGVFYHLRYPLLALDRICDVTSGYVLLESHCLDGRLVLEGGDSVRLSDVDPRLNEVALYQFYRHDELNRGDFSNWFAPNTRAIADALWSAGFEPELLERWDHRVAFKATKLPGIPEYRQQTYEGLQWTTDANGRPAPIWHPRQSSRP